METAAVNRAAAANPREARARGNEQDQDHEERDRYRLFHVSTTTYSVDP
jgi:hypothetical protein